MRIRNWSSDVCSSDLIAVRDNLALARENEERARELSRIARELVESVKEPPLRGLRADAALAQAPAALRAAEADEVNARRSLPALFGVDTPPSELSGTALPAPPTNVDSMAPPKGRLAEPASANT